METGQIKPYVGLAFAHKPHFGYGSIKQCGKFWFYLLRFKILFLSVRFMSPNKYNGGSLILFCGTHGTDK